MKVIFHIDLDSYFVSAERTVDSNLINKPVVISDGKRRSIISAASYEAKKLGIYIPMPFYKAKDLVPDLIAVEPNFPLYTVLSTRLFELLSNKITKNIEVGSIDECYMDVTDIWPKFGSPIKLAKYIQDLVLKELNLPLSIGIANNKFVAKMSTQINKPQGITVTKPGDFKKIFGEWETSKVHGIGSPTQEILTKNGINSINDLIDIDIKTAVDILGIRGEQLWLNVNEKGSDEINTEINDLKGIGNSITFMDSDKSHRKEIYEVIQHLCNTISIRLQNRNMAGLVVAISIKEKGGKEVKARRKQATLKRPIFKAEEIFEEAKNLFEILWKEETIKFVGVNVTKLIDIYNNSYQQSIFDEVKEKNEVEDIIHNVNSKLGSKLITTLNEVEGNIKKKQNQSRYLESDRVINKYKK